MLIDQGVSGVGSVVWGAACSTTRRLRCREQCQQARLGVPVERTCTRMSITIAATPSLQKALIAMSVRTITRTRRPLAAQRCTPPRNHMLQCVTLSGCLPCPTESVIALIYDSNPGFWGFTLVWQQRSRQIYEERRANAAIPKLARPKMQNRTDCTLTVGWSAPGRVDVSSYELEIRETDGVWAMCFCGNATSTVVDNLKPLTQFHFRVRGCKDDRYYQCHCHYSGCDCCVSDQGGRMECRILIQNCEREQAAI